MPNSVRKIAPVGQTSRQAAWVQCLQTSEDISQRKSSVVALEVRLVAADRHPLLDERHVAPRVGARARRVLSCELPVQFRPSSGTWFHSLQATSHALQPMQTDVSVKNPIRGGCSSWPAAAAGSLSPSRTSSPSRLGESGQSRHGAIPVSR